MTIRIVVIFTDSGETENQPDEPHPLYINLVEIVGPHRAGVLTKQPDKSSNPAQQMNSQSSTVILDCNGLRVMFLNSSLLCFQQCCLHLWSSEGCRAP